MPDKSKQYKIENFDFGFDGKSEPSLKEIENFESHLEIKTPKNKHIEKLNLIFFKLKSFGFSFRKIFKFIVLYFSRTKWKISRSIFLGRGFYFKYISHLSILIIIVFGTFVYMGYYASPGKETFLSKYAKADSSSESVLYSSNASAKTILPEKQFSIIKYKVSAGDTLSGISQKFSTTDNQISVDSIKWNNSLQSDDLKPGSILEIPPVTGILHTVAKGETAMDVATKYKKINDKSTPEEVFGVMQELTDINVLDIKIEGDKKFPVLVEGQKIIVPGGVIQPIAPPVNIAQQSSPKQTVAVVQAPVIQKSSVVSNLGFIWPVAGGAGTVTRGISSYHTGVDIADFSAPWLVSSSSGKVVSTQWELGGGGCVVRVKYDNGYLGLYAHSRCNYQVKPGQVVAQGQILVQMGSTGNSTGTHLHYELYSPAGKLLNPFDYVRR